MGDDKYEDEKTDAQTTDEGSSGGSTDTAGADSKDDFEMTPVEEREVVDTTSDEKKCPECDEPIDNVRVTCPNCGYEYKDEDYDDKEAGKDFVAGTHVDDEGNELPDKELGPPEGEADADESGSEDGDGGEAEKTGTRDEQDMQRSDQAEASDEKDQESER